MNDENSNFCFGSLIALVAIFVGLTGCAGKAKPEAKAPATNVQPASNTNSDANPLDPLIKKAAAEPAWQVEGEGWKPMFDGRTLAGWTPTDFSGKGQVACEHGLMLLYMGD